MTALLFCKLFRKIKRYLKAEGGSAAFRVFNKSSLLRQAQFLIYIKKKKK